MHNLLNLPMPIGILFEVFRNQNWKITVEENWELDPALIAIASRTEQRISVNGTQKPAAQAMAVTAIARLQFGSFCDIAAPDKEWPTIYEKDLSCLWDCERALINSCWEYLKTVLDAITHYNSLKKVL